jgi:hypothetical protein
MADNLVFEESLNTEIDQSEFIQKRWIYVNDNNSQNYTSQIVIDSTPLSNAGGWINWSEGFIVMPLVVQLTVDEVANDDRLPNTAEGSNLSNYSWAFKNGFWNMINSMTVEFNNQNIIQQTPFLNVFRSFKTHTSWSQDDLFNEGMSSGYHPDNAGSWAYCNDYSDSTFKDGRGVNCGFSNNSNVSFYSTITPIPAVSGGAADALRLPSLPVTGVAGAPIIGPVGGGGNCTVSYSGAGNPSDLYSGEYACNEGMRKRQSWTGYDPKNISNNLGQSLVNTADDCNTVYRSHKVQTQDGSVVWKVYAKLRLKDLADFFEKTPLLKGSTIRLYINTNQAITKFAVVGGTIEEETGDIVSYPQLVPLSVNVIGGLTNPLMLSSADFGQGMAPLEDGIYYLSVSIVKNTFTDQNIFSSGQTALTACRLYAPVYTMNPLAESKYLSLTPTKKIRYKDIFQYQFNDNAKGPFNFLVSNGISNIVSVLVVPFISKKNTITNKAGDAGTLTFQSYLSPVSTSPAVPDPIMLTNFNILISGVNLFLNNEMYDFEAFRQQLITSNQLNGSLTTGLASGLINEDMFSRGYRYYYGDCSRVLPSEEGVSRSVQIVGNNTSELICDLMVFVEFMREITIDISTGARIE